jgi:hypothetical protein
VPTIEPRRVNDSTTSEPTPLFESDPGACPVCNAGPIPEHELFRKQSATFVRCEKCSFTFINPRTTAAWIASRYKYCGGHYFTEPSKLVSDFTTARVDLELSLLRGASGLLLDIGCATGSFVAVARLAGFDARGIDISAASTRYGREVLGLPLEVGDCTNGNMARGSLVL